KRQYAGGGVIQSEKSQQVVAAPECLDRLRLEQVVDQRRAGRAEQYQPREVPEVWGLVQDAKRRAPWRGGLVLVRHGQRRAVNGARGGLADEPGTAKLQQREQRQHRRNAEGGGDAFGCQRTQQTAQRSGGSNMAVSLLGGVRVEPFAG